MSMPRLLGLSGSIIVAAILGGTLIGTALAAPGGTGAPAPAVVDAAPTVAAPDAGAAGKYCDTFRAAFAKALGVSEADVNAAARTATAATIDAALKDGKISAAAADRLKARAAATDANLCARLAKRAAKPRAALGVVRTAMTAAAGALGMTPADLRTALRDGTSLKTLAASKNVDYAKVSSAVLTAVKTDLDALVKAGTIKQPREDRILDRLSKRLENGTVRGG